MSTTKSKEKLELVHIDLYGPFKEPSLSGNKYFLYLLMTTKNMVHFQAILEKQSGHKPKKLKFDNRGEFLPKLLSQYCNNEGIIHKLTAPYTPKQNGVSERKNKTILNMDKTFAV